MFDKSSEQPMDNELERGTGQGQTATKEEGYGCGNVKDQHQRTSVNSVLPEEAIDGGWGWFVMIGCLLTHVIVAGVERSTGVLYLRLRTYYGQSAVLTSWSVSITYTLMMILGPLASALCSRFTVRSVVALGATFCSVGILLSAVAPDIISFFFSFGVLIGIGHALTYGPSLIILGQYFNKRRSLAAGIATSGGAVSACVVPSVLEQLFNFYGFSGTIFIFSAFASHFFISAALFRPPELHRRLVHHQRLNVRRDETTLILPDRNKRTSFRSVDQPPTLVTDTQENDDGRSQPVSYLRRKIFQIKHSFLRWSKDKSKNVYFDFSLLKNVPFLCLCIQQSQFAFSINTVFTYLPALAKEKGFLTMEGVYLLSILSICDLFARIIVSISFDHNRIRPYRLIIYNVNVIVLTVSTLSLCFMSTYWQLCLVSGLYGAASGISVSQKSVICVDMLGVEHLTSSFGILLAFQGIGSLICPTVGGILKDHLGRYDGIFYISSLGSYLGGVVLAAGNFRMYRRLYHGYDKV